MNAVRLRLRAEVRARWRAWLALVLLIAGFGAATMASAAGARRTASALDRAVEATKPPNIFTVPAFSVNGEYLDFDRIAALPVVAEAIRAPLIPPMNDEQPDAYVWPASINDPSRHRLLDGTLPDPTDPTSIVINVLARDELGWGVGDRVRFEFLPAGIDPQEVGGRTELIPFDVTISGIVADVGDLGGDAEAGAFFTEAFGQLHGSTIASYELFMFRLADESGAARAFADGVAEITGGREVFFLSGDSLLDQVRRSFGLQAGALWFLSVFLGIAGLLICGQAVARAAWLGSEDAPVLSWLGLTPRALVLLGIARAVIIAGAGLALGAIITIAVSPLFPIGRAALIEPSPGISVDGLILGLGVVGATVAIVLQSVPAIVGSMRHARLAAHHDGSAASRRIGLSLGVAASIGARHAIVSGRGVTAVPLRSSLMSAALGVVAFVTALVILASVATLLRTPRLYGWNWDVLVAEANFAPGGAGARVLDADPAVAAWTGGTGGEGGSVVIDGATVSATLLDPTGGVEMIPLRGRLPRTDAEIAMGPRSLRDAGTAIGGEVEIAFTGGSERLPFEVVGTVALPFTSDATALGEGVLLTHDGGRRLLPDLPMDSALIRFEPGADRAAAIERLRERFVVDEVRQPTTVIDFGRMDGVPLAGAVAVALLALGTVAHVVTSAIRRRRRDLAILRVLGSGRRTLRGVVAWQATIFMALVLAIGLPAGIIVGRWVWIVIADMNGFVARPSIEPVTLAVVGLVGLLVANAVAWGPARRAARTQPAVVLRQE